MWRSTRVFLGGVEAPDVEVLPDMEGIMARFELEVHTDVDDLVYEHTDTPDNTNNVAGPGHFLDPLKYIPFDDDGDFWLSIGGQIRGRLEIWDDFRFGASMPKDDDVYYLSRILLHTDLHLTKYARVFAEGP